MTDKSSDFEPVAVAVACEIGKNHNARQVVILALDDKGYSITTWGKTKLECLTLEGWSKSLEATKLAIDIAALQMD